MRFPELPGSGATYIPRRFFEQLKEYILAITPQASPDILPQTRPGGTAYLLAARPQPGGPSAPPSQHPFQLIDASDESTLKVRVRYGTLGGLVPAGMVVGDEPPYLLTITETCVVYGATSFNSSGGLTAAWVDKAPAVPAATADTVYVTIGHVVVNPDETLSIGQTVENNLYPTLYYSLVTDAYVIAEWSPV